MAFKFKKRRVPFVALSTALPSIAAEEAEVLSGQVQGKTASAGEERYANGLQAEGHQFIFRYVLGAPKGLPGWKELDFLVLTKGMLYAVEIDTAFTHANKQQKDKLHDAIILKDHDINAQGTLFPQVIHVDGEVDIPTNQAARQHIRRTIGKG